MELGIFRGTAGKWHSEHHNAHNKLKNIGKNAFFS